MKKSNSGLKEIGDIILEGKSFLLFPHIHIDGDALGSSVALCRIIQKTGKKASILIEEDIPPNIAFLDEGLCIRIEDIKEKRYISIALDCSDADRLGNRKKLFFDGESTICIDHHITFSPFAEYNYVDEDAAAVGEIIFRLCESMKIIIDAAVAKALYAAIATDTGNYQYSNTTAESHRITASLFDAGMDHNKVILEIYQNQKPEKIKIMGRAYETLDFFCEGRGCIAYVSREMLKTAGAAMSETDGIVEQIRDISGVEIAILLKEEEDAIKVGMRAKTEADVSMIAKELGGGGHRKAAGCSISGSLEEAKKILVGAATAHLSGLRR
jgi:phosphoesterase RecJ-like protein